MESGKNYPQFIKNISEEKLIFLDETGLNLHQSSNRGYFNIKEKHTKS